MNKTVHPFDPEDLMAYIDGELSAERASAAKTHLGVCAACKELADSFGGVSSRLRAWKIEQRHQQMTPKIADALFGRAAGAKTHSLVTGWREVFSSWRASFAWVATAGVVLIALAIVRTQTEKKSAMTSKTTGRVDYPDTFRQPQYGLGLPSRVPAPNREAPSVPQNGRDLKGLLGLRPGVTSDPLQADKAQASDAPPSRLQVYSQLQEAPPVNVQQQAEKERAQANKDQAAVAPMIIRTAQISLITNDFDQTRAKIESILNSHRGYFGDLHSAGNAGSGRTLNAVLRVPADQLAAALIEVKALGRVLSESQGGQDVTAQYVDLEARLGNSRHTEQRLSDLLSNRTGKLSDVLQVEREISRVRGEIEQMEAERKNLAKQVSYATLTATITEDYKAELQVVPPSTPTKLANAAIEGYRSMVDGIVSFALFFLSNGPTLLLWGAILFLPARLVWRKLVSASHS